MKTSTLSGTISTYKDDILTSQHWLKLGHSTNVPYDRREVCQLRMDELVLGTAQVKTRDAASLKHLHTYLNS